jgi:probable addiction module antidote protein
MPLETTKFDVQDHLKSPEDRAAYLEAAFEDGDPSVIANALGDVARAVGISSLSRETGISREGLRKALSETGDPRLSTLVGVMRAMGLHLVVRPAEERVT